MSKRSGQVNEYIPIWPFMTTTMSLADRIKEETERYKKKLEFLESGQLQAMLEEYEHCSKRLPQLKAEIEAILGTAFQEPEPSKKKDGGKVNRAKKTAEEVLQEMIVLLEKHPDGLKKTKIAEDLKVGEPKITEAFNLDKSKFEEPMRGPKAVIKLKVR